MGKAVPPVPTSQCVRRLSRSRTARSTVTTTAARPTHLRARMARRYAMVETLSNAKTKTAKTPKAALIMAKAVLLKAIKGRCSTYRAPPLVEEPLEETLEE